MKTILLLSVAATCSAAAFDHRFYGSSFDPMFPYDFGVGRQHEDEELKEVKNVKNRSHRKEVKHVSKKESAPAAKKVDDYEIAEKKVFDAEKKVFDSVVSAEKAVLHAAQDVEHAVEHAIHDEVDIMFPPPDRHEADNVSAKKEKKKPAFVRGKEKKTKEEEHPRHHFKPEVEEAMHEMEEGDMED